MQKLEARLSLSAVVAISISAMLGSGIFVLPGLAAARTGPSVWLAYLAAGLCVLPAALSKAELGTAMPATGGTYVYIDRTFGPMAGTIAGLGLWLSLLLKSAFALVGFGAYLMVLADVPLLPTSMVMLGVAVLLNLRGVRRVGQAQTVVVGFSLVGLLILSLVGATQFDASRLQPLFPHGGLGFVEAVGFVFVSFAGVTKIAAIAEEIKNPEVNLPRGILLSLAIVTVIYGGVTAVLVGNVPLDSLTQDLHPIYTLGNTLGGKMFGIPAAVLGVAAMTSMATAGLLAASRFPFAMSREKLLPPAFRQLHAKFLTPTACILTSGAVMGVVILTLDVAGIAKLASAFMIMIYMVENVAVLVLRETGVQWYKPAYRSPMYPWIQLLGVASSIGLLFVMGGVAIAAGVGIAVPGVILFLAYGRRFTDRRGVIGQRGKRTELLSMSSLPLSTTNEADLGEDAAVVVALFGRERCPEMLVELAAGFSTKGARIEVVHITEVPEQTDLDAIPDDIRISSVERRVLAAGEKQELNLDFHAVATRDLAQTVSEVSNRLHCRWLVIEWGGRTAETFTVRNPIGWLKNELDCSLAIFSDAGVRYIRRILVHVEPGKSDELVAVSAAEIAAENGATLTFVRFVADEAPPNLAQGEQVYLEQMKQLVPEGAETLLLRGKSETAAIATATAGYDLLITAEHSYSTLDRIRGTGSDLLTESAVCSVLRMQNPRSVDTRRFEGESKTPEVLDLLDYVDGDWSTAGLAPASKDELFQHFATSLAERHEQVTAEDIKLALVQRERSQNTAVGRGVALPHATLTALPRTVLGVFTTAEPLEYDAPDASRVDVLFVTLGPPGERHTHLLLLARIATLVRNTRLLEGLREAKSPDDIRSALITAAAEADAE